MQNLVMNVPNQAHLLNKYQINVGFSHFHEIGILSWDEHFGTISNRYCERMWFLEWENYINTILIFLLSPNRDFGRWIQQHLFDILFFTLLQKILLKNFA